MKKRILVVVGVLAATQVMAGCYQLRELGWSVDKVKPGESSKATIGLTASETGDDGRFFVYVTGFAAPDTKVKKGIFDNKKELGSKKKMVSDDALLSEIQSNGICPAPSARGDDPFVAEVLRTKGNVADDTNKFIESTLKLKFPGDAESGFFGSVHTGGWVDDGDGVPEDDEDEIDCSGVATTSVFVKGAGGPPEPRGLSLRDAFGG